ncbi:DUF424 family protein [Thermoplasmatales archaeon AK]|nr:DUF424 family protein [Thermoplasmatales archaeon AK]
MKLRHAQGEVLLAAADSDLLNREIRSGKLHITVSPDFYGDIPVEDSLFIDSLNLCTIANLVGRHVVDLAIKEEFIDPENVLYIGDVPHAQFARMEE